MTVIRGTEGDDLLDDRQPGDGSSENAIYALGGDDVIEVHQQNVFGVNGTYFNTLNTIYGGAGTDTFRTGVRNGVSLSIAADPDGGFSGEYVEDVVRTAPNGENHFRFFGIERFDLTIDNSAVGNLVLAGGDDLVTYSGGAANFSVDTGGGDDRVLVGTPVSTSYSVALGSGDDLFRVDRLARGSYTIDGGSGRDRIMLDFAPAPAGVSMIVALSGSVGAGYQGSYYIAGGYARVDLTGVEDFTVTGGASADALVTGDGDDVVSGGAGNDVLTVGAGADVVDGGAGTDALSISFADETAGVTVDLRASGAQQTGGTGSITGVESFRGTVTGSAFADTFIEGRFDFDATFDAGAGDDIIQVSDGNDTVNGGDGRDRLVVDYATAEAGVSLIVPVSGSLAAGYRGAFYIAGAYARADFTGIEDFTVTGGASADTLVTGDGDDVVSGGAGADVLTVGAGADVVDGGLGTDALSISFADEAAGVTVDLRALGAQQTGGTGSITGVESFRGTVTGSAFADTFIERRFDFDATFNAGAGDDTVQVSDGNDVVNGGDGRDRLVVDYTGAEAGVSMIVPVSGSLASGYQGAFYIAGGYARADFAGIEDFAVTGGASVDALVTGDGDDVVRGLAGSDVLTVGVGNDVVDGGVGTDALSISFADEAAGVTVDLRATGAQQTGGTGSITGVESFRGTVTGSAFADTFIEGRFDFDATFNAGAGDDIVQVSDGNDVVNGGEGRDRLVVDYAGAEAGVYLITAITGSLAAGYAGAYYVSGGYARVDFSGVEDFTVTGGASADTLTTGAGNDIIAGGAGNDAIAAGAGDDVVEGGSGDDRLDGGAGTDTVSYAGASGAVAVSLAVAAAQATGGAGTDTLIAFENLVGSAFADTLTGSSGDNLLHGGAGADALAGGPGDDTYVVDQAGDIVSEAIDAGIDSVVSGVSYTLGANVEKLTLTGGAVAGSGNALANVLVGNARDNNLFGDAGDDTLDGGAGADVMKGGYGDDLYYVDQAGDVVTEYSGSGIDTVVSTVDFVLGGNVENLTLAGSANLSATGNSLANVLTGNDGDNVLNGGGGIDTMTGGLGDDTYFVGQTADAVIEAANGGIDTVVSSIGYTLAANVENLTLTGGATRAVGNALANVLIGNSGDNGMFGFAGDDLLDGGFGNDTMKGGSGNDTYIVGQTNDVVSEAANDGIDTVISSIGYTLTANVENLTLTGGATRATGNALDNVLIGNEGADGLFGEAGNDTLDGREGGDTMRGGEGDDTYHVDDAADVVTEYSNAGTDTVFSTIAYALGANVENLTLAGTAAVAGTGNSLANVVTGNAAANVLDGRGGADVLTGGLGDDTFTFASAAEANGDRVTDFTVGDRIDLNRIDARSDVAGNDAFTFVTGAFTGRAGELRAELLGDAYTVSGDLDGDGVADFAFRVHAAQPLTGADFLL